MTADKNPKVITTPDAAKPRASTSSDEGLVKKKKYYGWRKNASVRSVFYKGKTINFPLCDTAMQSTVYRMLRLIEKTDKDDLIGIDVKWLDAEINDLHDVRECLYRCNVVASLYKFERRRETSNPKRFGEWGKRNCNHTVAKRIVNFASDCAVPCPDVLNNHYESFSSETYGETNFNQMKLICDELKCDKNTVFVDLGSGIGKLVCYMAAYARCKKSVGIELSDVPAKYANNVGQYFKSLMAFFGKRCGKFELHQGNILDEKFYHLITEEATVIFINNVQFDEKLNFDIKHLLQYCKPGTKIVTTKALGDVNQRPLTRRTCGDFDALSVTRRMKSVANNVSWTGREVPFWCTTMDQKRVIAFFKKLRR
uniref:Histone-lysine N-methyltransferase, H3 lysine-79 specific n=1 Tax=Caenorhabditis tropicalis TaxID=1561998 RepID=A0A1I7T3Q4_9PELO